MMPDYSPLSTGVKLLASVLESDIIRNNGDEEAQQQADAQTESDWAPIDASRHYTHGSTAKPQQDDDKHFDSDEHFTNSLFGCCRTF